MKRAHIHPYLFFRGRCEEALSFYEGALGAEVSLLLRHSDNPAPSAEYAVPPEFADKVMHATFHVGGATLHASDGSGSHEARAFGGFSLSLQLPSQAEVEQAFAALSEGGEVTLPLGKTFWSPCFGMLTDRFGIGWMLAVESEGAETPSA